MQRTNWAVLVSVAIGSAAGGVARHLISEAVLRLAGQGFPWGTIFVNVSGSLAIGGLAALAGTSTSAAWPPLWRDAMMTGVLGGYTTFSTFSVQTLALLQQGQVNAAIANVAVSVALALAACWAGFALVSAGR